ncbi:MAG: nucleotidyl transferase AbiEii/AbiGii toxin family protein [Thermoanaerobaculia bacterium]|nr:nucleotidyl transferase AbiEii/AbiGii toxin family protein [Thermoanaerobaculia bacterium]
MVRLYKALIGVGKDLQELGIRWALVGGIAVSLRSEPRTTRDLDIAVATRSNRETDNLIRDLAARGYRRMEPDQHRAHRVTGRVAMDRLLTPKENVEGVAVDLLFSFSGIEEEIVEAADLVEVSPGHSLPVATRGHLMALKVLAGRLQDKADFSNLLEEADARDLMEAELAAELIDRRGLHPNRQVLLELARLREECAGYG